jgi:hypothetical protein
MSRTREEEGDGECEIVAHARLAAETARMEWKIVGLCWAREGMSMW